MPTSSASDLDYLAHLERESELFADVMATVPPQAKIPSCPDWDGDDLLWHLGEVQWFWGTVVSKGVDADGAEERKPDRPAGRAGLTEFYVRASRDLRAALAASPQTPAWTWAEDQSVGFIRRRQAHEALIHRVDAELTAGRRTAMDGALSADGVDEILRIMYSGVPEWGLFTPAAGQTLRIEATDTGDSWLVTLGRFTGTSPSGTSYDEGSLAVADTDQGQSAGAAISGNAADLDCWLWNRPPFGEVARTGDPDVQAALDAVIAAGVQ